MGTICLVRTARPARPAVVMPDGPELVKISLTWTTGGSTDTGICVFAGNTSGTKSSYAGSGAAAIWLCGICLAEGQPW